MDSFFVWIFLGAVISGASCALIGVYLVGLRLPFLGLSISHAATAGIVLCLLLGFPAVWPAWIFASLVAVSLAGVRPERSRIDSNVALSVLFSLMLGLTFLGIGLIDTSRSEVLALLWGNILFVRKGQVLAIAAVGLVFGLFAWLFNKELKVLLFSRTLAWATGLHELFVYGLFLGLTGWTLAVNLPLVGGLLIFCLITNPAAAAYQVCNGHRALIGLSILFGVLSGALGFAASYLLDLPTGACIVTVSALIFGGAVLYRRLSGRRD